MVLMVLLGGVRNLFGLLFGVVVVGIVFEYFKFEFGDMQFYFIVMGILFGVVVLFMLDGVIFVVKGLFICMLDQVFICEVIVGELLEQNKVKMVVVVLCIVVLIEEMLL